MNIDFLIEQKKMKKFLMMIAACAMAFSFPGCGEEPGQEEPGGGDEPKPENTYFMVYQLIVPKDVLKAASVEFTVSDPIEDKSRKLTATEESETMFGMKNNGWLDTNLLISVGLMFNKDKYYVAYYPVEGVVPGMDYAAEATYVFDETKADALADGIYTYGRPSVLCYVVNQENNFMAPISVVLGSVSVSKEKFIDRLKNTSAVSVSGKLEFEE